MAPREQGSMAEGVSKWMMYIKVPKCFEKFYPDNVVLMLLRTIYGIKQAAMVFWKELLECMMKMKYHRNGVDPCLYFK
eukprot:14691054-Ditylum_brightwellii.AAC.1